MGADGSGSPIPQNFEGDLLESGVFIEKVKMYDKLGALKLAMQFQRMLSETIDLNVEKREPLNFTMNI